MELTHGSLFSGIGGFDLGFERANIKTLWQVECDPFCLKVLEKHWPNVKRYTDVRTFLFKRPVSPDILSGGFPCQDISDAGRKKGLGGERSGLWIFYLNAIRHFRPRYVVVENVAGFYRRGLGTVLGDLASVGYDAEWDCIPASAIGVPHQRDRVWVVAYPGSFSKPYRSLLPQNSLHLNEWWKDAEKWGFHRVVPPVGTETVPGLSIGWQKVDSQSHFPRMVDGLPRGLDRLKCLGNAVVPQIAEEIGRMIVASEERSMKG